MHTVQWLAGASFLVLAAACGSEDDSAFASSSSGGGGGASGGTGIGGGSSSGSAKPDGGGEDCVSTEAAATLIKRPVDIVFVIDNSDSMSAEISEVENQINENFAGVIGASGIDYRLVMLSKHGKNADQQICVSAPLSGGSCAPLPERPLETATFFQHSVMVRSHDAFSRILGDFSAADELNVHPNGYGELLRPSAFKVFVVITDDNVETEWDGTKLDDKDTVAGGGTAASRFDTALLALSPVQFGTAEKRNYLWHSIVGLARFDAADPAAAHPALAPIVTATCTPSAKRAGTGYQALSKLTGGLRYPSCEEDYTTIFQRIAEGIVEGAAIACELALPEPPAGQTLDLSTVVARFTPAGGSGVQEYGQVANAAACTSGAFYIEADAAEPGASTIKLCPDTCALVNATPGDLKIAFGCNPNGPH